MTSKHCGHFTNDHAYGGHPMRNHCPSCGCPFTDSLNGRASPPAPGRLQTYSYANVHIYVNGARLIEGTQEYDPCPT